MMKIFVFLFLLLPVVLANEENFGAINTTIASPTSDLIKLTNVQTSSSKATETTIATADDSLPPSCNVPPADTNLRKDCRIYKIGNALCDCFKCQGLIFMECNKMGEWKPDTNKENTMKCLECQSNKYCNKSPNTKMWSNCKMYKLAPIKSAVCECTWCPELRKTISCDEEGFWNGEEDDKWLTKSCQDCNFKEASFPRACIGFPPDTYLWENCHVYEFGGARCHCVKCQGIIYMKCNKMGEWEPDTNDELTTECLECQSTKYCYELPNTRMWSNCRIEQHEPNKTAVCECTGCRKVKQLLSCDENGRWKNNYLWQNQKCLRCKFDHFICPSEFTGCNMETKNQTCLCKSNCQEVVYKCNKNSGSIATSKCSATTGTMIITIGTEVRWTTTESDIVLRCLDALSTVKGGSVSCSGGKIDNVTMPICTKSPCKAPPNIMTCDLINGDINNNCTCNDNCREVDIQCRNETWEYDNNICLLPFEKQPFRVSDGTTVTITALKQTDIDLFIFEVHCTDDDPNVMVPGSATCVNGLLNVKKAVCGNNSNTSSIIDKYFTIPPAVLGCLLFICTIYVTVKKVQKHRMPLPRADDEEVLYDEIDLRYAVEPPVPEPPPRVHDGRGYLLVNEPYQYDVVGEEKPLEKWIKPIPEVSDEVEQDDVDQDPLSNTVEVPEIEDPMLHNPEEPEDPMFHKPEMPEDVDEDSVTRQLEESEYVDHNELHRYKIKRPNRPKLPDYVEQNDLEDFKFSHNSKVCEGLDQNYVDQNKDNLSVNLDEVKYADQRKLQQYKVKLSHKQEGSDEMDQNVKQCTVQISHKPEVVDQNIVDKYQMSDSNVGETSI